MGTFKGLIDTLEIRDDGWVEVVIEAVQSGNAKETFYIKNLDGDITMAHKRLAQLCLLRDAISRILPIEIDYEVDKEQGNLINEVIVYPRPSIEGREIDTSVSGVVIGVSITEIGPNASASPFEDAPDLAGITLLQDDGTLLYLLLDIQREEALTMHAMLVLLQAAYKTRRPVKLWLSSLVSDTNTGIYFRSSAFMKTGNFASTINQPIGYIESCEWLSVPEDTLDYHYAFVERLGQRYESYDTADAPAISHVKIVYTTSPGQTPEGDISDNGSFQPVTQTAWVHCDSPLLYLLKTALKKRLQVKLGLVEDQIHEVEVVGHIGSAARPIWICINQSAAKQSANGNCDNTPTIQSPSNVTLNNVKMDLLWKAQGYFNEGVWRFQVQSQASYEVKVDGKLPCCGHNSEECCCDKQMTDAMNHFYLKGMHTVELALHGQNAAQPFALSVYRIR